MGLTSYHSKGGFSEHFKQVKVGLILKTVLPATMQLTMSQLCNSST